MRTPPLLILVFSFFASGSSQDYWWVYKQFRDLVYTKPHMIVLDSDYMLWPFRVGDETPPPFCKKSSGEVYDANGIEVFPYPIAYDILERLFAQEFVIAISTRSDNREGIYQLLTMFDFEKFIMYKQVHPANKIQHLTNFKYITGELFANMLVFDSDFYNTKDIGRINVTVYLVRDGLTYRDVAEGLMKYKDEHR